jgi:hypothetical protein
VKYVVNSPYGDLIPILFPCESALEAGDTDVGSRPAPATDLVESLPLTRLAILNRLWQRLMAGYEFDVGSHFRYYGIIVAPIERIFQ